MARYRKLPVEVEARQYLLFGAEGELAELMRWSGARYVEVSTSERDPDDPNKFLKRTLLAIHTPEGEMEVSEGDWIIKGVRGEFYPCKPDIFEETYEKVED